MNKVKAKSPGLIKVTAACAVGFFQIPLSEEKKAKHAQALIQSGEYNLDKNFPKTASRRLWSAIQLLSGRKCHEEIMRDSGEIKDLLADAQYHYGMAKARCMQKKRAIDAFKSSIELQPTAKAYIGLGNSYWNNGEIGSAQEAFENALKIDPECRASTLMQQLRDDTVSRH